jgi:hypothetical protein
MTTYVAAQNLLRHVASGHDVLLVHAAAEPADTVAVHCNEPGCEWSMDHFVTVPGSDAPTVGGCPGCATMRQRRSLLVNAGITEPPKSLGRDAICRQCGCTPLAAEETPR